MFTRVPKFWSITIFWYERSFTMFHRSTLKLSMITSNCSVAWWIPWSTQSFTGLTTSSQLVSAGDWLCSALATGSVELRGDLATGGLTSWAQSHVCGGDDSWSPQGGAHGQFAAVPLNLLGDKTQAGYGRVASCGPAGCWSSFRVILKR